MYNLLNTIVGQINNLQALYSRTQDTIFGLDVEPITWKDGRVALHLINQSSQTLHLEAEIIWGLNKRANYFDYTLATVRAKWDFEKVLLHNIKPFSRGPVNPNITIMPKKELYISMLKRNERYRDPYPFMFDQNLIPINKEKEELEVKKNIIRNFNKILMLKEPLSGKTYLYNLILCDSKFTLIRRKYSCLFFLTSVFGKSKETKNIERYNETELMSSKRSIEKLLKFPELNFKSLAEENE